MKSMIIKSEIDKFGNLTSRVNAVNVLSRNEWEFRISTIIITPRHKDMVEKVFEVGCSMNTSECYDYDQKSFMDKNTPVCLVLVNAKKNKKQKIDFSQSSCPWLKVENVKDIIEISFTEPGTNVILSKGSLSAVIHLWIRRK